MKASDAFPSRYLQTSVVKDKSIVAVISHVELETVGQGADQKRKPVLYLDGQKPMVLNRTNFETLADAFGDSDEWSGRSRSSPPARNTRANRSTVFGSSRSCPSRR